MVKSIIAALAALVGAGWLGAPASQAQSPMPASSEHMMHAGAAARATLSDPSSIEPFLDGYVAAAMADQYPPGLIVAVATRDAVFVKGYGVANMESGEKATTETLFRIASISKTFVWTAVMMLVDEGKIDLDADINTYLKTARVKPKFGKPVTMNDLMAHRGGFEDSFGVYFQSDTGRDFETALMKTAPARVAPPGGRTAYSNWGTSLAALAVADISGMPFDTFVETRILTPLGMTSTVQHDPAAVAEKPLNDKALDARMAAPHHQKKGAVETLRHDALDPLYPAGAVALDARDAARWLQFFLNNGVAGGRRLLSPQAFTLMRLRAFPDRTGAPDFAHGFMETEIAGARTFGHGGALSGFLSDMTVAPSLGLGVFVVANGATSPRLPDLVSRAVIEQFAASPDTWPKPWRVEASEAMKKKAKSLAGAYRPARRVEKRFEKIVALSSDVKIAANDDGSLTLSSKNGDRHYYPLAEDLWSDRSRDRLFVYRNADGSVNRLSMSMGTDSLIPASFLETAMGFNVAILVAFYASLLVFIAAWRRQGREIETTSAGKWLALGQAGAAVLWFVFVGVLVWATLSLSSKTLADFQAEGWPPAPLRAAEIAAYVATLGAIGIAAGTVPVFLRSGWSLWRKGHYVVFALAGLFAAYMLVEWRFILAGFSGLGFGA